MKSFSQGTNITQPTRQPDLATSSTVRPHHLYQAIDAIAETEWADQDEFEAQVVRAEHQIEVHLNEIILESVSLLQRARTRQQVLDDASAHHADVVTACETLRDRALEKRQELLQELELAVNAGHRTFDQVAVSR